MSWGAPPAPDLDMDDVVMARPKKTKGRKGLLKSINKFKKKKLKKTKHKMKDRSAPAMSNKP